MKWRSDFGGMPFEADGSGEFRIGPWTNLGDVMDAETGWNRPWHFLADMADALFDAHREERQVSLIFFRLELSALSVENRLRRFLTMWLRILASDVSYMGVHFGRLSEDEFAICIPHTEELDGAAMVTLLQRILVGLAAETAVVTFPEDGDSRYGLLDAARSRLTPETSNLVDLDAYRRKRYGDAA